MTYNFICDQGHDPETLSVEASSDAEALIKLKSIAKDHLAAKHAGMTMPDEQLEEMLKSRWTKS